MHVTLRHVVRVCHECEGALLLVPIALCQEGDTILIAPAVAFLFTLLIQADWVPLDEHRGAVVHPARGGRRLWHEVVVLVEADFVVVLFILSVQGVHLHLKVHGRLRMRAIPAHGPWCLSTLVARTKARKSGGCSLQCEQA